MEQFFSHEMADLSWLQYEQALKGGSTPILVPVGAIEQHGPHLPLATDTLIPHAVCLAAAKRLGALVAPALTYGYKSMPHSGGGQHFCGSTGVDAATLTHLATDLVRSFTAHGVRRIVFVIGHMENQWFMTEACDLAFREAKAHGIEVSLMRVGYWEFVQNATIEKVFGPNPPDWNLEHAGIMETSLMLHLYPEKVRMELVPEPLAASLPVYDLWPYDTSKIPASGILNSAVGSSAEIGALFFEEFVEGLSQAVRAAFSPKETVHG